MRGPCEFDDCACPKFTKKPQSTTENGVGVGVVVDLCQNCNHAKVWHKNITVKTNNNRIGGFGGGGGIGEGGWSRGGVVEEFAMAPPLSPHLQHVLGVASAPILSPVNRIDMSCLVCHERRRNVLVLPCRHLVLCGVCFDNLPKPECVMCRKTITSHIGSIYI